MTIEKFSGSRKERISKLLALRTVSKYSRCLVPCRCVVSDKFLFLQKAVRMRQTISGPGTPVILDYWVSEKEFLLLQLAS